MGANGRVGKCGVHPHSRDARENARVYGGPLSAAARKGRGAGGGVFCLKKYFFYKFVITSNYLDREKYGCNLAM